jgi:hypothetical protein
MNCETCHLISPTHQFFNLNGKDKLNIKLLQSCFLDNKKQQQQLQHHLLLDLGAVVGKELWMLLLLLPQGVVSDFKMKQIRPKCLTFENY